MDEQFTQLSSALSAEGFRLTTSRRAILAALVGCGGHITADELVERVHQQAPNVGRMTVYRTLDLLCQLNLIRPVYQGTGAAHFVLLHHGHHHHLVCGVCHKVIEFDDCVLAEIEKVVGHRFNFEVQGHLLEFYGLCAACRGV
ncbi:MAG: transcriptional repressor [Candidatus Promineifilaceae bacterium]